MRSDNYDLSRCHKYLPSEPIDLAQFDNYYEVSLQPWEYSQQDKR